MLERARATAEAEGLEGIRFEQADAQVHDLGRGAFDVAVSSFGAMFFDDPTAAFANIARSLRPGGRLGLLAWQELAANEWLVALRRALEDHATDAGVVFGGAAWLVTASTPA